MTAQVTIAGATGSTPIEVGEGKSLRTVLEEAAATLGFTGVDLGTLTPVVNGEDANDETTVVDGDVVTAAPKVENGGGPPDEELDVPPDAEPESDAAEEPSSEADASSDEDAAEASDGSSTD